MYQKDVNNKGTFDIKQLNENFLNGAALIWGGDKDEIIGSILVGPASEDPNKQAHIQEHHNARHALWFIYMVVTDIISGREQFSKAKSTNKIIAHLVCLKEFIDSSRLRLRLAVRQLSEALLVEFPDSSTKWTHFLFRHWFLVRTIAKEYQSDEKCFSLAYYEKVSDVLHGRQRMRFWWWKAKMNEGLLYLRHHRQVVGSKELRSENGR